MPEHNAPQEIVDLATQRAMARSAQDWPAADELRGAIEASGWRVVDVGTDFVLSPAQPDDVVEAERTLYGAPGSIPSRLDEPDLPGATIVVALDERTPQPAETLASIARFVPPQTRLVVVAAVDAKVGQLGAEDEVVWTVGPFSPGAGLQAALRRAVSSVVVVVGSDQVCVGDVVTPLLTALEDPDVAVAGLEGLISTDLRRYHPAEAGDVSALGPACFAFRRADATSRDRPDERLHLPASLAAWWSLSLRDEGNDVVPRRAVAMALPLQHVPSESEVVADDHARLARRDAYRIAHRFGGRPDLALLPD